MKDAIKNNKKVIIIGTVIIVLLLIGITFAFFSTGGTQDTANTFTSGCLNIELTDASSSIKLTNTYPISDVEGVDSTSYDFTIRNTCDTSTNYSINLESLNEVAMRLATKVYEEAAKNNQAEATTDTKEEASSNDSKNDDVEEANYEEK